MDRVILFRVFCGDPGCRWHADGVISTIAVSVPAARAVNGSAAPGCFSLVSFACLTLRGRICAFRGLDRYTRPLLRRRTVFSGVLRLGARPVNGVASDALLIREKVAMHRTIRRPGLFILAGREMLGNELFMIS